MNIRLILATLLLTFAGGASAAYTPSNANGQATMANSSPVVIASDQSTVPVSLASIPVHAVTQSGTWNINSLTTVSTVTNLAQMGGQAISMGTGTRDAGTQRVTIATNDSVPVTGTFWQATQPVSGTFWQATQPVSGPLTDTQLRASAVPVSMTSTTVTGTVAVTQSGTWNLAQMGGTAISMGTGTRDSGTQRVTIATNDSVPVTGTFWQATQPVSGTFWQATQPVSAASLPLPAGAATAAKQPALGTAGTASSDVLSVQGIASMTALKVDGSAVTQPVSGTFWQATQPVSAASLPLPSGASTSAKQPALGTAGTASSDVLTVQGIASMTALKVDGSAVTQPVSGTFWQATQPVSGTVAATQSGTWNIGTTSTVTNLSQLGGQAIAMNTGTRSAGTQRVTIATDDVVPASQSGTWNVGTVSTVTNLSQLGGQAVAMGTGVRTAGTQRVTLATDDQLSVFGPLTDLQLRASPPSVTISQMPSAASLADATALPTTTHVGAEPMMFNGVNYDRQRGNWETTTGDSGAKTATFNGATQTNFNARGAYIVVRCNTVSGTSPTMIVALQFSPDGGTSWFSTGVQAAAITASNNSVMFMIYPTNTSLTAGATPTNATSNATQSVFANMALPRTWRLAYTIGGTTPSFSITAVNVSYLN